MKKNNKSTAKSLSVILGHRHPREGGDPSLINCSRENADPGIQVKIFIPY